MTDVLSHYNCSQCHTLLEENEKMCVSCGSIIRSISIQIIEEIKISDSLELKKFTQGLRDFVVHMKQGWFPSVDTCKHPEGVDLTQTVDRENNLYIKKVIDKKTGITVKDLEEPLTSHH